MAAVKKDMEARRQDALDRLGEDHPVCVTCGEDDPRCLELNHVAGRKYDDTVAPVCRNCHRKLSDDQRDHPDPIGQEPGLLERVGHFLLGLADLFVLIAHQLKAFGHALLAMAGPESLAS